MKIFDEIELKSTKPDFMDEECPKGGHHKPVLMNDNYQFKCSKCDKKED